MLVAIGMQDFPAPMSMYGRIVPGGNAFANFIQSRRYVSVRTVKDQQRIFLLQHFPVRIGLGYMRPHRYLSAGFGHDYRKMGGKRSAIIVRNQNREWIRTHESHCDRLVLDAIKFRNVHFYGFPANLRLFWLRTRMSINLLKNGPAALPQQTLTHRLAERSGILTVPRFTQDGFTVRTCHYSVQMQIAFAKFC